MVTRISDLCSLNAQSVVRKNKIFFFRLMRRHILSPVDLAFILEETGYISRFSLLN